MKAVILIAAASAQLGIGRSTAAPEPPQTTFVGYLRIAFRWGGFPGWEQHEKRPEEELKFLTEGLLPI